MTNDGKLLPQAGPIPMAEAQNVVFCPFIHGMAMTSNPINPRQVAQTLVLQPCLEKKCAVFDRDYNECGFTAGFKRISKRVGLLTEALESVRKTG